MNSFDIFTVYFEQHTFEKTPTMEHYFNELSFHIKNYKKLPKIAKNILLTRFVYKEKELYAPRALKKAYFVFWANSYQNQFTLRTFRDVP